MKITILVSIIFAATFITEFSSCSFNKKEITQAEFECLLAHDSISNIRVTNNKEAEISLKTFHKNDKIYILPIKSSESFERSLNRLQVKLAAQNIHPLYQSVISLGSNGFNLFKIYETIMLSSIGLFLFAIISVLKNRFESSTDKLIWFLVILIPFVGPLLYLFIGKKQRLVKR